MTIDPRTKHYDPSRMIIMDDFVIPQLNRKRTIRIYLPDGYEQSQNHYPVIYMHDGQNVFEPSLCISGMSWQAGESIDAFQRETSFSCAIIVAVDCSGERGAFGRRDEYSPWPYHPEPELTNWEQSAIPQGGDGEKYCQFIVDTLKPFIDNQYRTLPQREYTSIAGSSMGGLISLYALLRYPSIFANAGVFSPAFWFASQAIRQFIHDTPVEHPVNIYMDIGTAESSDHNISIFPHIYQKHAAAIANQLSSHSPKINCQFHIIADAIHSESAWALRFPAMLAFFFPCISHDSLQELDSSTFHSYTEKG
ncbi:alpha/beta hydrolase [Photobacterium aquae]|uniref:alpha/beta hydrolase n=1 Tax=Photobacterium aquae TaxID=1195763 RepID=UPI00069F7A0E|nr:alpha/beta hydrolase-fold protein [Photobacterium aquae]